MAEAAARAAGAIIRRSLEERVEERQAALAVRHKGPVDLVTEIDLACEAAIRAILEERCPGVPVLAEEGGGAWNERTRWVVDPLDGTMNFVHGFPSIGVSIALQDSGTVVVGCIYDPLQDHAYVARRECGATCNGRPIHVSAVPALDEALLVTGFAADRRTRAAFYVKFVAAFLERAHGVRRPGAASIDFAHVAAGRLDGYWEFGLKPWDVAAGALLVEEAGGRVTDVELGPLDLERPRVLASNGPIHEEMAAVIRPLLD